MSRGHKPLVAQGTMAKATSLVRQSRGIDHLDAWGNGHAERLMSTTRLTVSTRIACKSHANHLELTTHRESYVLDISKSGKSSRLT